LISSSLGSAQGCIGCPTLIGAVCGTLAGSDAFCGVSLAAAGSAIVGTSLAIVGTSAGAAVKLGIVAICCSICSIPLYINENLQKR
jgi:hypothetical protein